eukprot:1160846-Pelagomonas_calceolata.AAC.3
MHVTLKSILKVGEVGGFRIECRLPDEPKLESCQLRRTFVVSMQKTGNFRPQMTSPGNVCIPLGGCLFDLRPNTCNIMMDTKYGHAVKDVLRGQGHLRGA